MKAHSFHLGFYPLTTSLGQSKRFATPATPRRRRSFLLFSVTNNYRNPKSHTRKLLLCKRANETWMIRGVLVAVLDLNSLHTSITYSGKGLDELLNASRLPQMQALLLNCNLTQTEISSTTTNVVQEEKRFSLCNNKCHAFKKRLWTTNFISNEEYTHM